VKWAKLLRGMLCDGGFEYGIRSLTLFPRSLTLFPIWIKSAPRILVYVSIQIRPIHEPRRIPAQPHPRLQIPIAEMLPEQARRIFLLRIRPLPIRIRPRLHRPRPKGLVAGGPGQRPALVALRHDIPTPVAEVVFRRTAPQGVQQAPDAAAHVGAAAVLDGGGERIGDGSLPAAHGILQPASDPSVAFGLADDLARGVVRTREGGDDGTGKEPKSGWKFQAQRIGD